jgi:hypothetical protein
MVSSGFKTETTIDDDPAAKQRNKERARNERSHIETLRQNTSFQWFYDSCIERGFQESRRLLEADDADDEELPKLAAAFRVMRGIARWMDARELEHRRLENPNDPQIAVIRARLDLH